MLLAALSTVTSSSALAGTGSATPWIVELKADANVSDVLHSAGSRLGIKPTNQYSHLINGFAASLTSQQKRALAADPRVTAIVPDQVVRATGDPATEAQPGVRRVGALQNSARNGATLDVDIAIVDTGIQPDHPDLNVVGGYNCTGGSTSAWADGTSFGHGTHVAGIAAARNNGSGVEGVAAGARLWSIKVLTNSGLGYWSWVICGLDHVASMDDPNDPSKPRIEVVNMSLAGGGFDDGNCGNSNNDPLHQAVCRLERIGVTMVVAAGNAGANAMNYIPAAYDEVITVSGMADYDGLPGGNSSPPSGCAGAGGVNAGAQGDDKFAKFSDYGPDVDILAPAVCILSTLPNSSYGRMTGTSMATPHVSGGAALFYLTEANAGHGRPTTREVRAALRAAGSSNWKTGSDPDGTHEPLLDVSTFNLAPDFQVSSTPQVKLATGGGSPSFDIWLARLGGFGGAVNISVGQFDAACRSQRERQRERIRIGARRRSASHDQPAGFSGCRHLRHRGSRHQRRHHPLHDGARHRGAHRQWRSVDGHPRHSDQRLRDPGADQMVGRWRELPAPAQPKRRRLGNDRQHWCHEPEHDGMARQPLPIPRQIGQRRVEVRRQLAGRARVPTRGCQPDRQLVGRPQFQLIR